MAKELSGQSGSQLKVHFSMAKRLVFVSKVYDLQLTISKGHLKRVKGSTTIGSIIDDSWEGRRTTYQ